MIPLCWYHHARCYEARVHGSCPSSLRTFFCRQRKLRRVKGKTFFVAETQCQVIIYGNGGQSFPWQEQTFNSHGRARSTRRTPRCVTIATYNERNYLPHSLRASSPIVKSRRARGTREETRKWLGPTRPRRSLALIRPGSLGELARRLPIPWNCVLWCGRRWVLPCVFSIVCITSFETSPVRNIKKYPYERDARM